ncbi:hypothetical protein ABRP72_19530 [Pectobacterium carotovorum]|uniref:hypothetical protein n=1 Tax=Pectobacterium carotovorum TaxID=554 RepID=UPI0032EBD082
MNTQSARLNNGQLSELPPMRGLDIRIQWGKAIVMRVIDERKADNEEFDAVVGAQSAGYRDFSLGETEPPRMLADIPELVSAWLEGWGYAASCYETSTCKTCQNDSGEPCPYHD